MTNFKATKQDIETIPFDIGLEGLEGLENYSSWILPQALAKINKSITLVRNEQGLISPSATLVAFRATLGSEKEQKYWINLLRFLTRTPRGGKVLGKLKALVVPQYSALVPLALSAFKQYRDVPYSMWDWTDPKIGVFVDPTLLASVNLPIPKLTKEELLDLRDIAKVIKTTGQTRTLNQMTAIYATGHGLFDELPSLTRVMLLQTWVAQPEIRHPLQILHPNNLDEMPEPLIPIEIVKQKQKEEYVSW